MTADATPGAGSGVTNEGLWGAARRASRSALASGALRPISTRLVIVEEGGVRYQLRIVEGGTGSGSAARSGSSSASAGDRDPFRPWEPALFVADVGERHVALLNKYPVVADHLLVVTRELEEQETPLETSDWQALWHCLDQGEALGFYNSGSLAGASQRHRHLQLVPLPLVVGEPAIPIEARLPTTEPGRLLVDTGLPFRHLFAWLDDETPVRERGRICESLYREALARQGGDPERPAPYNLLVTRRWLLFVPRTRAGEDGVPVNALGFAGALLARGRAACGWLRGRGPSAVLAEVSGASPSPPSTRTAVSG